jgi:CubicO group peptidase (beta-lactamase class C family)
MTDELRDFVLSRGLNFYDIAVITDSGAESVYCQPCNACNDCYSIAKLFVGTAIGVLVDSGRLTTDDRLTDILGDEIKCRFEPIWNRVTVKHALTHRMGLDKGVLDIDTHDVTAYGTRDYLAMIFSYAPKFEPGSVYKYTDVAHYLLARVITRLTGLKADEFINEKILVPLSFREAAWSRCPMNYTIGSSGLYARAGDIVKLAWTYLNNGEYNGVRIISPEWVSRAEKEGFDLTNPEGTEIWCKGGMLGQMLLYDRAKHMAAAWHSYEPDHGDSALFDHLCGR